MKRWLKPSSVCASRFEPKLPLQHSSAIISGLHVRVALPVSEFLRFSTLHWPWSLYRIAAVVAIILIAGCARPYSANRAFDAQTDAYAGRLSLQVASDPPQSFSGNFDLKGNAANGELTLISPLGNVVGVLRWTPGEAVLDSGNGKVQRFASIDDLMLQATGASIPIEALFAWLQGNPANVSGWSADLSRHADGRISARRVQPAPEADLRLALDR